MSSKSHSVIYLFFSIAIFIYLFAFFLLGGLVFFILSHFFSSNNNSIIYNQLENGTELRLIIVFFIEFVTQMFLITAISNYKKVYRSPGSMVVIYGFFFALFIYVESTIHLSNPGNYQEITAILILIFTLIILGASYRKYKYRYSAFFFFSTILFSQITYPFNSFGIFAINMLSKVSPIYFLNMSNLFSLSFFNSMLIVSIFIFIFTMFFYVKIRQINLIYAPIKPKAKKDKASKKTFSKDNQNFSNVQNNSASSPPPPPPPPPPTPQNFASSATPDMNQQQTVAAPSYSSSPNTYSRSRGESKGDTIAMVGFSGGGKTTFLCLFVYSCRYVKGIPGFNYSIEKSSNLVKDGLESILKGEWPSGTLKTEMRTETEILLRRKQSFGNKKVTLKVNDISGEIWKDIANSEDPSVALGNLLRQNPKLEYLPNAEGYLITIECSTYATWDTEQLKYLDLLKAIVMINNTKRVKKHLGIVLTKFDTLPVERMEAPVESILSDDLHSIDSYIKEHFDYSKVKVFKTGMIVDQNGRPQVFEASGKRVLQILGGGEIGEFQNIFNWMLQI